MREAMQAVFFEALPGILFAFADLLLWRHEKTCERRRVS